MPRAMTHLSAFRRFLRDNDDWLTDSDLPAVMALEAMARDLDDRLSASIVSAYLVAYRALLARKPVAGPEEDEVTRLLRESRDAA